MSNKVECANCGDTGTFQVGVEKALCNCRLSQPPIPDDARSRIKDHVNAHVQACFTAAGVSAFIPLHPGPVADAIIAEMKPTASGLLDQVKALREALEDVRRDLIIRAGGYPGEKEGVVVNLSNSAWIGLKEALKNSQQGEG